MKFYSSIHSWYDQIFIFAPAQRDFILSFGSGPEMALVDAGCGTGSLIVSLAKDFGSCTGLDPDESMLEGAREKAAAVAAGCRLVNGGMLDLEREFAPASVDRLICFGNTLPHLTSLEEVHEMFRQASSVLKPDGLILLQIINFQRIFRNRLPGLPTLENDQVRFVRNYRFELPDPAVIRFHTLLTIKATGVTVENDIPLLAITEEQLAGELFKSGLNNLQIFGGFGKEPFTPDSQPMIIVAGKRDYGIVAGYQLPVTS